ncbi:MAG TPA: putative LPS assembly protein LptD [Bacteroidia bacterium]|nr:putative LPS assembly protein LptD [Bacteroidia bacterium]
MKAGPPGKKESTSQLLGQVTYHAKDSMLFDLPAQKVYLWDSATVDYQDTHLSAYFVTIDFKKNIVIAEGKKDSTGNYITKANFSDNGEAFEANKLSYNYVTGKGKIIDVITEQGDGFLHAQVAKKDTSGTIYVYKGYYTTCDLEHPHFAIRARKLKVIQDDKIITGPAYLEVSDVPTPIAVPFGFFPNKKGRASGILIPTYGESPTLGFFLKDGGYYWGKSDLFDLALRGDIYSKGSWGAKLYTNYKVRYKYSGNFSLKYSRILQGDRELPNRRIANDFFITWSHTQDPKSNPSIRFSANVRGGTSTYNSYNSTIPTDYLSNTFNSNISWSKSWKFGALSANLRHDQNSLTHNVSMTLPQIAFTVNRFYPFRNPKRVKQKWYDKVGMSYTADFQNLLSIGDSSLSLRNADYITQHFRNGIHQSLPISTSFNVLRHFTLTYSLTLNSITQFNYVNKRWDGEQVVTDTINGAKVSLDGSTSLTLSTRLFGMYKLKQGRYTVIRHTLTPNLSFSYMPDFTDPRFGFYKTVQTNSVGASSKYSIFENGIYGATPAGRIGSIGLNLINSLEAKLRPDESDSSKTEKRTTLIDAFNVAGSYNLIADHFNWSMLSAGFRTKLFHKVDVNTSFLADPYRVSSEGVRIERFEWREGKRLVRLTGATVSLNTSLRKGGFTSSTTHTSNRGTQQELDMINANPNAYVDFNIPWSLNFGYSLNWSKPLLTQTVTQTLHVSGDVNVTPKWKVGFDSNYDIKKQEFGFTSLNIYRDLHCWEMQFNWIPFGPRQSYNITINVKSSVLQDLRLTRKRDWYDFTQQ